MRLRFYNFRQLKIIKRGYTNFVQVSVTSITWHVRYFVQNALIETVSVVICF